MKRIMLFFCLLCVLPLTVAFGQFTPRTDYVWARDVLGETITLDGLLNETAWAKAESVVVRYGFNDGMPGSGWKIMNGSGVPTDSSNAVIKFLSNKVTNTLYIGVYAKDSSICGGGWENSDGILGGIYNRLQRASVNGLPLQQDMFVTWIDSPGVGTLPNLKGGALPSNNIVTVSAHVFGVANQDTNALGQTVADTGWSLEMAVNLDSLGYNANSPNTDAILMSMSIWDSDWLNFANHVATKAWWLNEWGNNGGATAGRVLVRNDVNINTLSLPAYPVDLTIPNGVNFPDVVVDGDLNDSIWIHVPELDLQYGNTALHNSYTNIGPDRAGEYVTELSGTLTSPIDPGMARVKMFFKGDKLYLGADISDQALWHYVGDDFFDGLQVSMNIPVDTLRDPTAHVMAGKRFGFGIDSVSKGGEVALWDAKDLVDSGVIHYAVMPKPGSTIDDPTDIDAGYMIEAEFDLTKLGYTAGELNKTIAIGLAYHDYDITPTDTTAYRTWWYREWPWSATPAFCVLNNSVIVTGVKDGPGKNIAKDFVLYGNYPNPFNPTTKIRFSLPGAGTATVRVFDMLGRQVDAMRVNVLSAGIQEKVFDASRFASGVYYYRVEFTPLRGGLQQLSETKKMILTK